MQKDDYILTFTADQFKTILEVYGKCIYEKALEDVKAIAAKIKDKES